MIDDKTRNLIRNILLKHINSQNYSIFLFGSRATSRHTPFSDVDIGIEGKNRLPGHVMQEIKGDFEESNIPFRIDVVDFSMVGEDFKHIAMRQSQQL